MKEKSRRKWRSEGKGSLETGGAVSLLPTISANLTEFPAHPSTGRWFPPTSFPSFQKGDAAAHVRAGPSGSLYSQPFQLSRDLGLRSGALITRGVLVVAFELGYHDFPGATPKLSLWVNSHMESSGPNPIQILLSFSSGVREGANGTSTAPPPFPSTPGHLLILPS